MNHSPHPTRHPITLAAAAVLLLGACGDEADTATVSFTQPFWRHCGRAAE